MGWNKELSFHHLLQGYLVQIKFDLVSIKEKWTVNTGEIKGKYSSL